MTQVYETHDTWKGDPLAAAKARLKRACKVVPQEGGGTAGHNAFYGGCLAAGNISYHEHPCHAYTKQLLDCKVLFSRMVHPDKHRSKAEHVAAKEYFKWITGPDSPWREVFGLGMTMDGPEFKHRFWWAYGFLFDRMDVVPANLLQNFLVATRQPKEWPHFIGYWHQLVLGGCNPAMALYFASMFQATGTWTHANKYDFPLDHGTTRAKYVQSFAAGITPKLSQPFNQCKEGSYVKYWPVNCVWGNNEYAAKAIGKTWHGEGYAFSIRDTYSKEVGTRTEHANVNWNGTKHPKDPVIEWSKLAVEDVVAIIKKEEGRLQIV